MYISVEQQGQKLSDKRGDRQLEISSVARTAVARSHNIECTALHALNALQGAGISSSFELV